MHFRISTIICWALLIALTSAAQNTLRNNREFEFDRDAEIEGSGYDGEVNRDLESSGSGQGPPGEDDDEDGESIPKIPDVKPDLKPDRPPSVDEVVPKKESNLDYNIPDIVTKDKGPIGITPTEDTSVIMNPKPEDRPTSFFSQPGILAAVIGGAVVGLLCAILVVMFIVYRMRKKDEGSYALGEPKQSPNSNSYSRGTNKEFYA
ncbi:syndecan-like [Euwallacea similis]|uniref:syndecan-like n=1 Tax=Euwallacea similis TaxID=1736056 RepID=UPI00344D1E7C